MATRIAVLKDGIIQQFGTPAEIYERPANTFVATFMGSPSMNLVPVTVVGEALVTQDGQSLPMPARADADRLRGRQLLLGLRPE